MTGTTIEDICDYFIIKAADSRLFLNLMKLHKLVYYSEAWWLAQKGEPLAGMSFHAWVHGPVNLDISSRFRSRKKSFYMNMDRKDASPAFDAESIPVEVRQHLNKIMQLYVGFTGNQLEEIVCNERPWIAARGNTAPNQRCENDTIDPEIMQQYYAGLLQSDSQEIPAVDERYTR